MTPTPLAAHEATRRILEELACARPNCPCQRAAQNGRGKTHCPAHEDRTPSLSVSPPQRTANPLVRCFTGCSYEAITAALRSRNAWPERTEYRMAYGYVHIRRDGPNGKRISWANGAKPQEVLYGELDDLQPGDTVLLVEGEKACEAAISRGFAAVATVCGASTTPTAAALKPLERFNVVLCPDNDESGRDHMRAIAASLGKVRWLELPNLPEKGDIADWKGSDDELDALVSNAPFYGASDEPSMFVWAQDLDSIPEMEWLIEGFAPVDALCALVGGFGSRKTFILLDIACSIATGIPWHGRRVKQGIVVYVFGEGLRGLRARVRAWEEHHDTTVESVAFVPHAIPLLDNTAIDNLLHHIRTEMAEQPVTVVFDTLARMMVGGDENSTKDMGLLVHAADQVRRETGATVWFAHHTNRRDEYRGNTAFPGALDMMAAVETDGMATKLSCLKMKDAEEFETIDFLAKPVGGSLVLTSGNSLAALHAKAKLLSGNPRLLLDVLNEKENLGMKWGEWQASTGLDKGPFNKALASLKEQGLVRKDERHERWISRVYAFEMSSTSFEGEADW